MALSERIDASGAAWPASPDGGIDTRIVRGVAGVRVDELRERYLSQGRFLVVDPFLDAELVARWRAEADALGDAVHRSYIPGHKQGGSIGWEAVAARAPSIAAVYRSGALRDFVTAIVGEEVSICPPRDPHACALYVYSRPGDHIGYHYDTSYYRGSRFTVLVGLVDESSSVLACRLHTRSKARPVEELDLRLAPGALCVFDGDAVEHAVTPLGAGERRTVVTMQYVTSGEMNPLLRLFSDLKDAVGYFGFREVFLGRRRRERRARLAR